MAASKAILPLVPGKAAPAGGAWTTARLHAASDRISNDPVVCTWQRTRFAAVITQPSLFALRLPECRSRPTMRQTHPALVRAPACRGAGSRGSNGRTASGREIPACCYLVGMSSARYRWAKVAASDLFLTCSLAKTFPTWVATVLVLMYRRAAISALVSP